MMIDILMILEDKTWVDFSWENLNRKPARFSHDFYGIIQYLCNWCHLVGGDWVVTGTWLRYTTNQKPSAWGSPILGSQFHIFPIDRSINKRQRVLCSEGFGGDQQSPYLLGPIVFAVGHRSIQYLCNWYRLMQVKIWRFPAMGVPPSHPFIYFHRIFHEINHLAIGVPPLVKPPYTS